MQIPKQSIMMQELINQIKRQAVREACSNSIELKYMFPTKESFIEALNGNSPILMILLPKILKLPKGIELRHVDYISTVPKSNRKKKDEASEEQQCEVTFRVTTSDFSQRLILKKDINQLYEKVCELRMSFAFRLEDGYTTKEWYDYN